MFFAPGRWLKHRGGLSYPLLFVCLSFSFLLFLGVVLLVVRGQLMKYCEDDINVRLDRYISNRSSGVLISTGANEDLQGLSFVRLIGENEQYFYSESPDSQIGFQGIVNLDPDLSAVWISLTPDLATPGYWTIRSKTLGPGFTVQAGMRHENIVILYTTILKMVAIMAAMALLLSGGVTYLSRRKSAASLREAEHFLRQAIAGKSSYHSAGSGNEELDRLVQLLNKLISQNNQLIKEMQESLDNVAHDLRTPMTRLRSVAEYGLQQESREKTAEALSDCLEESERVLSMLSIMMRVAEAETGTLRLSIGPVQLHDILTDVVSLYEYVAAAKNISIVNDVESHRVVEADGTRIMQVFANILDNAIKYGKKDGFVRITSRTGDRNIAVVVSDNGIGISASEIDRIWERLFRGDRSRSEQGLGLGLNYVRAVVEAHGGKVSVSSTLTKGSTFEVLLPRIQGEL